MSNRIAQSVAASFAALLLVTACGDQSPLTLPATPTVSAAMGGANPIVVSVKGSGQLTTVGTVAPYVGEEEWRTFTVNATMRADGSVSGQTQYNSRINGGSLEQANVVCMQALSGASAGWVLVGAEVTHRVSDFPPAAFAPFPAASVGVDHGIVFLVKDNGEGAGAVPDRISTTVNTKMLYVTNACAGAYNALLPGLIATQTKPIEAGNIQVNFGN